MQEGSVSWAIAYWLYFSNIFVITWLLFWTHCMYFKEEIICLLGFLFLFSLSPRMARTKNGLLTFQSSWLASRIIILLKLLVFSFTGEAFKYVVQTLFWMDKRLTCCTSNSIVSCSVVLFPWMEVYFWGKKWRNKLL